MTVVDYVCIGILWLFLIAAAVKGFAKIIMRFFAFAAAAVGARFAAAPLVDFLYGRFRQATVLQKLNDLIPSGSIGASLDAILDTIRGTLSEPAYNIASFLHLLPEQGAFGDSLLSVETIEANYVQPIVTKVLVIITTVVLFTVFMIILNIAVNLIDKGLFKKKKGAVNAANRILGGIVGLAQGAIPVGVGCLLLNVIAPLTENAVFADMVGNTLFSSTIADIFR